MLKFFKSVLCVVTLLGMSAIANAQEVIKSDMTVTKPLCSQQLGDNKFKFDPTTHNVTLRVFTFGSYLTYELELSGPVIAEANKSNKQSGDKTYFSWTGSTDWMNAAHLTGQNNAFLVADTQRHMDGFLAKGDNGWMVIITGQLSNCITDIHTGSSLTEVQSALKSLGRYTAFKETGTKGSLKEYTLTGMQFHDDPIYKNKTHVRNDDPYARFYFNSNNKLVKWYMMKR